MPEVSTKQFAMIAGEVTDRQIRNYCRAGMPGARMVQNGKRACWLIDPALALPWLRDPQNARIVAGRLPIELKSPPVLHSDLSSSTGDPLQDHISMLTLIVNTMLRVIADGNLQHRVTREVKVLSSELRELRELQRRERAADAQMIDREHHKRVVSVIAALVQHEGRAMLASVPESIMLALGQAGIDLPDRARAVLAETVKAQWSRCLARMAMIVEDATAGRARFTSEGTRSGRSIRER